ncbi:MAG: hypothetical protein AAF205_00110 [Pseudomonadota bacterium]
MSSPRPRPPAAGPRIIDLLTLRKMIDAGWSQTEAAKHFGVTRQAIHATVRQLGLKPRLERDGARTRARVGSRVRRGQTDAEIAAATGLSLSHIYHTRVALRLPENTKDCRFDLITPPPDDPMPRLMDDAQIAQLYARLDENYAGPIRRRQAEAA